MFRFLCLLLIMKHCIVYTKKKDATYILTSDLLDPRSGSGRIIIWKKDPVPAGSKFKKRIQIRFRPDLKYKKRSGSGRILAEILLDSDPVSFEKICFPLSTFFSFI